MPPTIFSIQATFACVQPTKHYPVFKPTHNHLSLLHPSRCLYAVGIAVRCHLSRGGFQPRLFLLLDFRPCRIQPSSNISILHSSLSNRPKLLSKSHDGTLSRLSHKNRIQANTQSHTWEYA